MSNSTKIQFPATFNLVQALLAEAKKQGITVVSLDPTTESGLKENRGYCFLRFEGTHEAGASLIIPKAVGRMGNLHSHVDLSAYDGYVPLPRPNGKVICHFAPDPQKVAKCLKEFLSAAKRATAVATPKKTVATPVIDFTMPSDGEVEADSWATSEPDDEAVMQLVVNGQ